MAAGKNEMTKLVTDKKKQFVSKYLYILFNSVVLPLDKHYTMMNIHEILRSPYFEYHTNFGGTEM